MAKLNLRFKRGTWQIELDGTDITDEVLEVGFKAAGRSRQPEVVLHFTPGAEIEFDDMTVKVAVALEGEQDG